MRQNMFFPIYEQLEKELIDLGFYISFDRKQKLTYSIKIADLILRTVSEIENLACELCKVEQIKFRENKSKNKGKIRKQINFHEYISALNKIYDLEHKTVNFVHKNAPEDCFENNLPFQKYLQKDDKETQNWYFAYNKIKHDRIKNYKYANLENLVEAMSALFLLNIYYKDEEFYTIKEIEYDEFIDIMENKLSFSKVFEFGIGKPCNLSDQDIIELLDQTLGQGVKEVFSQRIIREPGSLKKRFTEYQSILKKTESYLIFKDIRVKTKWNICQDNLYDFCLRFNGEKPKAKISKNSNNHTDCTFYAKLNKELR